MVLLGALFKCLDPILILASIESWRSFFVAPPGTADRSKQIRQQMAMSQPSDHLAFLNAYREWRFIKNERGRVEANRYAFENLMHSGGLKIIEYTSEQLLEMLVQRNLVKDVQPSRRHNNELGDPDSNINSDVQPLVFSLLIMGLMPNLAVQKTPILLQTSADSKALIHPNSLNSGASDQIFDKRDKYLGAGPPGTIIVYSSKSLNQGGVFLRETSIIGPMTAMMFAGKVEGSKERRNVLTVDDWLPLRFETEAVREALEFVLCVDRVRFP
jgi:ATP-dependent RNA helicase DHX36